LHRRRSERYEGNRSVAKIKLRVKPEIVFNVIVRRPVRSSEFECMSRLRPGNIVFELITLLVGSVRKKRRGSKCARPARSGSTRAQTPQTKVNSVVVQRNRSEAVVRNDLNEELIEQVGADRAGPTAENADVPDEQSVTVGSAVGDSAKRG